MALVDEFLVDIEEMEVDQEVSVNTDPILQDTTMVTNDIFKTNNFLSNSDISSVAKLKDSLLFEEIMKKIDFYTKHQRKSTMEILGSVEDDPEYLLILDANNLLVQIDNEIDIIHHFVRMIYSTRFSELEQLVQLPMTYLQTVQELGNNIHRVNMNENLLKFLTKATIMIISVTASTTRGQSLTEEELTCIMKACEMAIQLNENKQTILSYIESRMTFIAPNLSIIVGSATAAKLMGIAGGLKNLRNMPSCHILLLGTQKKALEGYSSKTSMPHTGTIFYSKIVQDCPPDVRTRMARLVACKVTLAARVDSFHESPNGEQGKFLSNEIKRRLDKLQEPPPIKAIKPLPLPMVSSGKKRGGRRHRKMRKRLGMTQLRTQANRMEFGKIEEDIDQTAMGHSLGMIRTSGSGKIRVAPIDPKSKARMSQTLQKDLQRQRNMSDGSTTVHDKKQISGMASSVVYTPREGFAIVNSNIIEKTETGNENLKYFSNTFGFLKISPSIIPKEI